MRYAVYEFGFKNPQAFHLPATALDLPEQEGRAHARDLGLVAGSPLSCGDAQVSDRHANFFVNTSRASAKDMLALIADVRERVQKAYGVGLENEVVVWNA